MTIFLVILAALLVVGTAVIASGRSLRRPGGLKPRRRTADGTGRRTGGWSAVIREDLGLVAPVAPLPPVLLPGSVSAQDVDAVRFGLGMRGYRMDQVDEVLDRLAAAIAERDAEIEHLRLHLTEQGMVR
ncbi:DivIVA domain-containing protein [Arthrobacter echini]|uniref:DivIVA domain-containing protein n=1 Tax=Arthrobacter echini TaxID=1529066 RepID=A0A4S5E3N3_9MICC|nr:DivIVA domain-containing protein [Arthrobacter echini]THJ66038.1 DivIVA domain-containing protein [Arthrobacter echini]